MSLTYQLALRFLVSKKRQGFLSVASWVSILGLAFGVAVLLISLSVVTGFQTEYRKSILGFNSHVVLMNADEIERPEDVQKQLEHYNALAPMAGSTPFIYREGMVVSGPKVKGIVFKGVDFEKYGALSHMVIHHEPDSDQNKDHLPEIVLGKNLAEELQLKEPVLKVLFPESLKPKDVGVKNIKRFFVAGTFASGLYEYDSSFAFLSLQDAERFFQTRGKVSGIEVWLADADKADLWAEGIRKDFGYPYAVMTWRELNENIFRALAMEKLLFAILMTVLIAVAALNLVGTLMMLFLEKRGDAAILRALGMSWKRLRKIFIFDGLLIGSAGIVLGLALGGAVLLYLQYGRPVALAPEVYFLPKVPVLWSWRILAWVVGTTLAIVFVSCQWAAKRMSRVNLTRSLLEA